MRPTTASAPLSARSWCSDRHRPLAVLALGAALLALAACRAAQPGARPAEPHPVVRELSLNVGALEPASAFFERALGARPETGAHTLAGPAFAAVTGLAGARAAAQPVAIGGERVTLLSFDPAGRAIPDDSRSNDLWFEHAAVVVGDLDRAAEQVRSAGAAAISEAPQTIPASNPAAGGVSAFYFRGPDRHPLELIHFPAGRGLPRWQQPSGDLVLGVDHTAIAVESTDRSLAFYRGLLGLAIAGESLNQGREQEALSGVPSARVRITGLRGEGGIGVELLEYLEPRGGRPRARDARVDDLITRLITIEVSHLDELAARLARAGSRTLSPAPVDVSSLGQGWNRELIAADPDGHLVRLVERAP